MTSSAGRTFRSDLQIERHIEGVIVMQQTGPRDATSRRAAVPDLIRWGPTIAGVLIAAAVFTTVNAAWLALVFSSPDNVWRDNVQWLVGGTAAVSLFLAGLFAGLFSGVRGAGAGMVNGATAWGLFFLISIAAVLPGAFNLNAQLRESFAAIDGADTGGVSLGLWTGFWTLLIGAVLSLLGGAIGGALGNRGSRRIVEDGAARRPVRDDRPRDLSTVDHPDDDRSARSRDDTEPLYQRRS